MKNWELIIFNSLTYPKKVNKGIQILFVIFLVSCQQKTEEKNNIVQKNSSKDSSSSHLVEPKKKLPILPLKIDYNYKANKKQTPWQGNLIESAQWTDARGENVLIISELPQYFWEEVKPQYKKLLKDIDDTEVAELFAYHYIYNNDMKKWKAYWVLNDLKFSCCDVYMNYLPGSLKISDLDNNGKAESVFAYYSSGGTQSIDLNYYGKLILHVDSAKYSIKSMIGLLRNREDLDTKKYYSKNFKELNEQLKEFAESSWTRTNVIRDSMDKDVQKEWAEWNK